MSILEITGYDCGGSNVLGAIKLITSILDIVFVILPILLILMLAIDIIKNITSSDESTIKKTNALSVKRIILLVIICLIEPVTHTVVNIANKNDDTYLTCIKIAKEEDISKYVIEAPEPVESKNKIDIGDNKGKATTIKRESEVQTGTYDIKDKDHLVGIMYTTWFDAILGSFSPELIGNVGSSARVNQYYFWGEPALGFYKSSDKKVIKKHMEQLSSAGVDFIILDNTNMNANTDFPKGSANWEIYVTKPMTALLDTIVEMRKSGEKTPYVVNWVWTGNNASGGVVPFESWKSVENMYDEFYTESKYKDVWVYWDGLPFIITTSTPTSSSSKEITTRSMWGLNGVGNVNWSYLEKDNDKPGKDSSGNIEQIGVSVAMQATYMSNTTTATGRNNGKTFYNQWQVAFKRKPKIVTITWWNEWCALRLSNGAYTDLYSQEYSRDIEPMKGGHGDQYYKWMKSYITAYKKDKSCPNNTK